MIQNAVGLYCRFTLSFRDVEDLLAERGLDVSYETVRRWVLKFGQDYARRLRRFRPRPDDRWHLDEMFVTIRGRSLNDVDNDHILDGLRKAGWEG
jgi:transposase-like protein